MPEEKEELINRIFNESCLDTMARMPENFIDLTITSPPYNVGIKYDGYNDSRHPEEYFDFIKKVASGLYRVTKKGGRLCLNVPFIGNSYLVGKSQELQFYPSPFIDIFSTTNWIFRDFFVWIKSSEPENPNIFSGNSTTWGSWLSPSCPYARCFLEAILIFHKEDKTLQEKGISDITKEEFLEYTKNAWYFPVETNREHPAPYPLELPKRCMKLFSWVNAIVYDPFAGSGTTPVACVKNKRRYIASETSEGYYKRAVWRVRDEEAVISLPFG
ncbi:MAG: DNA adenine methyltransferase YhdJ [candidate division WS2 bacterium]|nr:DNA adenine methyltransferase YhdJ [Candidatus Lithacetigena glycinireducens]